MRGCALLLALLLVSPLTALPAAAYRAETLQDLTFLAAKRFNRCVEGTSVPRLTALQVRNLVRGNLREADTNFLRRATRWNFYDRNRQDPRRLLWSIDTRFHDRFDEVAETVLAEETRDSDRYENLGTVVHYLQTVTIPADVVPIFHPRPWRWPAGDRFTLYQLDPDERAAALGNLCPEVLSTPEDETFETLLDRTAAATMAAIRSPIADMDATWHAFWEEDEPGRFGSYGPAGNSFGREARFSCGEERCVLLADDPIYREFALTQHRLAVLSSMRAVLLLQRRRAQRDKTPRVHDDEPGGHLHGDEG